MPPKPKKVFDLLATPPTSQLMLKRLKTLFADTVPTTGQDETQLAAAVLLFEAANMDGTLAQSEEGRIQTLLEKRFGLSDSAAQDLCAIAKDTQADAIEISQFTRTVKSEFDEAERIELIEMLWEVAYADGELCDYEANLLRRVGGLLYVSDQANGAAKKRVLEKLGHS